MISPSFSLFFLAVVFTFQVPGLQGKTKGGSPGEVKSDPTTCHNFTVGTPKERKFYSPNYPNYYTSMTECTLILTAPPENLISVDFRGQEFRLEEDVNCTNDYLEVRDGAYGYSRMIGRYCGHKFPPIIISSYRYLHLRFHSDETIEYSGFAAQYQFIHSQEKVPERPPCRFEVTGEEARISRADIPSEQEQFTQNHGVPLDCTWVITVRAQWMSLPFLYSLFIGNVEAAKLAQKRLYT
ncbi:unnamed protein product [Darwinula stevensoni]|uniref:CUB domain-containing protein n=1 Tax=Darwinula stevensoni TaxID=69355 RepID=A0A7R8X959_9CRUS|nr:unnamed protein product [Darwinula stevensoni]CAG0888840.1 unnamed protein product [Darwinula stevensoni]